MPIKRVTAGDTILDRYDVKSIQGESKLGISFLVNDRQTRRDYLFNQLSFECDGNLADQLRKLVDQVKRVSHKSLANVYEFLLDGTTGYVSMEYIEGETFREHIAMRRSNGQILGLKTAYSFLAHLCAGLSQLHGSGLYYGCLTPEHIFVTSQGRVKSQNIICSIIADRFLSDADRAEYFGSRFVAPECRTARNAVTSQCDVYSLALLFAELQGNTSFSDFDSSAETFIAGLSGVSSAVKEALFSAVKDDPTERFADVQGLKESLKLAVDAPADNDLSSIVVGVSDLRALSASGDFPVLDGSQARKLDLFDKNASGMTPSLCRRLRKDVWLYQKDGLDYGPFDKAGLLNQLYSNAIHEQTPILNTVTKEKKPLIEIEEFTSEVEAYIPVRAQKEEEARRARNKKTGAVAGTVAAAAIVVLAAILTPIIILMTMGTPEPLSIEKAFPPFEKQFEIPKEEVVALNVNDQTALAIFDPKASAAEREAAIAKWEEEHRKKYASMRRQMAGGGAGHGGAAGADGDEIEKIVFGTDDDGKELLPLMEWEVTEQLTSARAFRKQSDCFVKYANGRRQKVTVNFTIQQSGVVRGVSTDASGELNQCLVDIFASMHFRQFGGTVKKVSYPLVYN